MKKESKISFTKQTRQDATDNNYTSVKIRNKSKEDDEEYRKNCENNKIGKKK